jgi:hypothetical protein
VPVEARFISLSGRFWKVLTGIKYPKTPSKYQKHSMEYLHGYFVEAKRYSEYLGRYSVEAKRVFGIPREVFRRGKKVFEIPLEVFNRGKKVFG